MRRMTVLALVASLYTGPGAVLAQPFDPGNTAPAVEAEMTADQEAACYAGYKTPAPAVHVHQEGADVGANMPLSYHKLGSLPISSHLALSKDLVGLGAEARLLGAKNGWWALGLGGGFGLLDGIPGERKRKLKPYASATLRFSF